MNIPRVQNMQSSNGNDVPNQFIIENGFDTYFQSYQSIIVKRTYREGVQEITLDANKWNYSITTGKYRNMFLGETKKETQKKIDSGEYGLADLNK